MLRPLILILLLLSALPLWALDLSSEFSKGYKKKEPLYPEEVKALQNFNFYLVPGILSESFIWSDTRSHLDFSILTKDYFSAQLNHLNKVGLSTERLSSSSMSAEEIKTNIRNVLIRKNQKSIFITHSLGGLALLEELIENQKFQNQVAGIIFIQSPFWGTPMADTYLTYPYHIDKWIKPVLPFLNASEETIVYLGTEARAKFMHENRKEIENLLKAIPVITVGGVANGHKSLFKPAVDIMEQGCIEGFFGRCLTRKFFPGPYDQSDGMVPLQSSKLHDSDFVTLERVDHGETVVSIPFGSYKKEAVIVTLLKLLIPKIQGQPILSQ